MSTVWIFDLDDTLYPERAFVFSGFAAVGEWLAAARNITGFAETAGQVFLEGLRGKIFDEALRRLDWEPAPALIADMVQVYRCHHPRISLDAETRRFLGRCDRNRLGLITDGYAVTQRSKVAALGLAPYLGAIIYSDELGRENWKPSPEPFRKLMRELACAPDECVYVGDNPAKDFAAPNRLGWKTVQLVRPDGEYSHLRTGSLPPGYRAQREIHSLAELEEILR